MRCRPLDAFADACTGFSGSLKQHLLLETILFYRKYRANKMYKNGFISYIDCGHGYE